MHNQFEGLLFELEFLWLLHVLDYWIKSYKNFHAYMAPSIAGVMEAAIEGVTFMPPSVVSMNHTLEAAIEKSLHLVKNSVIG